MSAPRTLGIISAVHGCLHQGRIHVQQALGRVFDRLAARVERLDLCIPVRHGPPVTQNDYVMTAPNIEVVPQPFYASTLGAMRHPLGVPAAYVRVLARNDAIFVRGLVPFSTVIYGLAALRRRRLTHWIISNPVKLLRTHQRSSRFKDAAAIAFAWQAQQVARGGRRLADSAFVCNGDEVGAIYRSARTVVTVSSTISEGDFFERDDTCQTDPVKLLLISYIRPEKGVEYLIEALSKLKTARPWELRLVGSTGPFAEYRAQLEAMIAAGGFSQRVHWMGHAQFGAEMFGYLRAADVFILPTLSEGTPRVLIEARANSLPIVSTNVGGIPTSVKDGQDGLLVPPKDAGALAAAIDRVIEDGALRRALIVAGRATARRYTIDRFVSLVLETFER